MSEHDAEARQLVDDYVAGVQAAATGYADPRTQARWERVVALVAGGLELEEARSRTRRAARFMSRHASGWHEGCWEPNEERR